MKKFIKFLVIFTLLLFVSCEAYKDDFVIQEHDGFSTLMYFDTTAQMKVYYLERDNQLGYTAGDTILYREAKEGIKIVANGKCFDIYQLIGLSEVLVANVCSGENGHNGNDASEIVMISNPYLDQYGNILGQTLSFYLDKDSLDEVGYGVVSDKDVWRYSIIVKNGVNGTSSMVSSEIVGDSIIFTTSIDGRIIKTTSIKIPKDGVNGINGVNGLTPALQATATLEGVIYLWYIDLNSNKSFDNDSIDSKLSENLITNGTNGTDGKSFYNFSNEEDANVASSYYYDSIKKWSLLGTPESMNHEGAPAIWINGFSEPFYNGTMIDYDYLSAPAIVWCPPFNTPAGFNYLTLDVGSRDSSFVELFVKYADGRTELVKSEWVIPVPNFIWYLTETYAQKFTYEVSVNNLDFTAVRWGLRITEKNPTLVPKIDWKNHVFHGDNFKWRYVLPIR